MWATGLCERFPPWIGPACGYTLNLPTAAADTPSMDGYAPRAEHRTHFLRQLAALAVGVSTFLLIASVVEPRGTVAAEQVQGPVTQITPREAEQISQTLLARQHPARWPVLGMLEGTDFLVLIYGSPHGPRYTVCSRLGELLAEDLEPADVAREFPDLDIPGMKFDPISMPADATTGPLMLVDPMP